VRNRTRLPEENRDSHVYVDLAGLIWSYPLKEVNRYIERLVDAGFEDRVMFGTDQLVWPKLMAYSIGIIQNADSGSCASTRLPRNNP
jgi:predicted TIM-barrel fold metal-dependent hydrolase